MLQGCLNVWPELGLARIPWRTAFRLLSLIRLRMRSMLNLQYSNSTPEKPLVLKTLSTPTQTHQKLSSFDSLILTQQPQLIPYKSSAKFENGFYAAIIKTRFLNRKMSLIRKASKATLRLPTEDFSACMDQKNAVIASLQGQVQSLRSNQQKYDRAKEQLSRARARQQALLRDHEAKCAGNQERLELSARNVCELRLQAQHLEEELRLRTQALKDAKYAAQQLIALENRKEDEATEARIRFQEQKSLGDVKKMEEERTRLQLGQLREEVEKGRRENAAVRTQSESVSEKCYKTQSYIRSLMREQTNLNETLSRLQDENSKLDGSIAELDTAVSINQGELQNKEKDCQELQFHIASKELEKRRMENEIRQKVKLLSSEKEKYRALCEQLEQKRQEAARAENQLQEASAEINFIISKNNEILDVNEQLREDLKVCQRHLENVGRVNKALENEVQGLHETSLKAISKLNEPFSNRTNFAYQPSAKWGTTSRVTDYETGDFERKSARQ